MRKNAARLTRVRAEDIRARVWPVQLATLVKEVPKRGSDYLYAPTVVDPPRLAGVRWSRLRHVAEVEFIEWTSASELRHASFQGLRKDKTPDQCVREVVAPKLSGGKRAPRSEDEA